MYWVLVILAVTTRQPVASVATMTHYPSSSSCLGAGSRVYVQGKTFFHCYPVIVPGSPESRVVPGFDKPVGLIGQ